MNTAHGGLILGSKIAQNTIAQSQLNFPVATYGATNTNQDLAYHESLIEGVHGTNSPVVGTTDTQILQNKTTISAFSGSKIALFTGPVEEIEKVLFIPGYSTNNYGTPISISSNSTDDQLIIRNPATTLVTAQITNNTLIPVTNANNILSEWHIGETVRFYRATGYTNYVEGTIASIDSAGNTVTLTTPISIENHSAAVNTSTANPLFQVASDGSGYLQNLTINNSAFQNITFKDDLTLQGSLQVTGSTTLGGGLTINGILSVNNTINAASLTVAGQANTGSIASTGNVTASGNLQIGGTTLLEQDLTVSSNIISKNITADGSGTFSGTVTAPQIVATTGLYNGVNLPLLYTDFSTHRTTSNAHTSANISYDSSEVFDSLLPSFETGVTKQAIITADPSPSNGYVEVDRVNLFHVGDIVIIGDDDTTFVSATISSIFQSPNKIYLSPIPTGLSTSKNARVVKKMSNVQDGLDALAISHFDHVNSPSRAHRAKSVVTDSFSFSSSHYVPELNSLGDATLQAVLNEFGTDLYHHIDGVDANTYSHRAQDVSFSNTLAHMGRRVLLTSNALAGSSSVVVQDATHLLAGDSIELHSDTLSPQSFYIYSSDHLSPGTIILGTYNNAYPPQLVQTTIPNGFNYLVSDNAYVLDFTLKSVQDALEALSTNYDLTNHIIDPVDAHDATAISFDNSSANFASNPLNVQAALNNAKTLIDANFTSITQSLNDHLNDPIDAHDASAISLLSYNSNMSSTDVQSAFQEWNLSGDIPEKTFAIVNNVSSPANVVGLYFDKNNIRSATIHYSIYRHHIAPPTETELAAVGTVRLIYKTVAQAWLLDDTYTGDSSGVTFSVLPSGQVQYTSSNISGTLQSSTMHYRAIVTRQ